MRPRIRFRRTAVLVLLVPGLSALSMAPASAGEAARPQRAPGLPVLTGSVFPSVGAKEQLGSAVALSRAGGADLAFVGAPYRNNLSGVVYVYSRRGQKFRRQATIPDPAGMGAFFGAQIAASGGTVAITANGDVYVYGLVGSKWQHEATLTDLKVDSLAMSGTTLIAGSHNEDGAAEIYVRSHGAWILQEVINQRPHSTYVDSVAVSGSTAVLGTAGTVYVYVRSGSRWFRTDRLTGAHYFGQAVAVSGAAMTIGAWETRNHVGLAYIYQRSGQKWRRVAAFRNPAKTVQGEFGYTVSMSGRRALIGAPSPGYDSTRCGQVYEFVRSAGHWRYGAKIANPGCAPADTFGWAMALRGRTALIGSPTRNHNHGGVYELTIP